MLAILLALSLKTTAESNPSLSISYEPEWVRVAGKLLPGDIIKVNVEVTLSDVVDGVATLSYIMLCNEKLVDERLLSVNVSRGVGHYSFKVELPWCDVVNIGISHGETKAWLELKISPEVSLKILAPTQVEEVWERSTLIARVMLKSNIEGKGLIIVKDETLDVVLHQWSIELPKGSQVRELYIKIPENPARLGVLKEWNMLHRIRVEYKGVDTYEDNNYDRIYVVVKSSDIWRVPWAIIVTLGFIVILAMLILISKMIFA